MIEKKIDALSKQIEKDQSLNELFAETQSYLNNEESSQSQLSDNQSRWTKEGLFDIREDYGEEDENTVL